MNRGKSVNSQCRHLELKNFSHLQNQYIIVMGTLPFHESIYRSRNPEFGVYFKSEFILFFFFFNNKVVQSGAYKCSVLL